MTCRELKGFQRRAEVARELAGEYITLEPETTLVPSFAAVLNAACEGAKPGTKPVPGIVEDADVARRRVLYDGSTPSFSDALFEETSEKDDAGEEGGAEPVGDGCEPTDQSVEPAAFGAALKKETGVKLASDRSPYYVNFDTLDTDSPHNDEFGFFTVYVMTKRRSEPRHPHDGPRGAGLGGDLLAEAGRRGGLVRPQGLRSQRRRQFVAERQEGDG